MNYVVSKNQLRADADFSALIYESAVDIERTCWKPAQHSNTRSVEQQVSDRTFGIRAEIVHSIISGGTDGLKEFITRQKLNPKRGDDGGFDGIDKDGTKFGIKAVYVSNKNRNVPISQSDRRAGGAKIIYAYDERVEGDERVWTCIGTTDPQKARLLKEGFEGVPIDELDPM
jgi:hypothetical protein